MGIVSADCFRLSCSHTRCDLLVEPELGQICFRCLRGMFLLGPPTSTSWTVITWWWVREDAHTRPCYRPCVLLQLVHAGAPRSVTDRLHQRLLNATARRVNRTRSRTGEVFRPACQLALAWCDRSYKLAVIVHRWLHDKAPKYPTDCCVTVSDIAGSKWLHRRQLDVSHCERNILGQRTERAFSIAGLGLEFASRYPQRWDWRQFSSVTETLLCNISVPSA